MKIYVTGGSGFLGGHLIEHLVGKGHEVVAMARSDASATLVESYGATASRADLSSLTPDQVAGCEVFIHGAARAEEWGTRKQFWSTNVEGTSAVLGVARQARVRRFIHVGTEAAVFSGHDLIDIDETYPYPKKHRYLYSETKAEAEKIVLAESEIETLSIRPRLIWGPRDTTILPALLVMHRKGVFAWIDGGRQRISTAHVSNVVHALELALTRGAPGRAYFVVDEGTRTIREFVTDLVESASGITLGERNLPSKLARPVATLVEGLWRLLRIPSPPPMSRIGVDFMSSSVTVSDNRARTELTYAPVTKVEEGMAELKALREEKGRVP